MKTWRCDACKQERLTDDNIIFAPCRICIKEMRLVEQRERFVSKVKEEDVNYIKKEEVEK